MPETLTAGRPSAIVDDPTRRTIAGLVVPYGTPGYTSAGPLRVRAGAVRLPADLSRIKLFGMGHDRETPVAYAIHAAESTAGLLMTFKVAPTPAGDTALVEAAHHVRDAFSVELDAIELDGDLIVDAELTAVALLALPAFPDARVAAVAAQRHERPTMPASPTPTPAPPAPDEDETEDTPTVPADPDDDGTDDEDETAPDPAPRPAVQAGHRPAGLPGPGRRGRAMSFGRTVEQLRRTVIERGPAALVAALADITPAADTGQGFLRPQWLDEIWTPVAARRDFISSVQNLPLTSGLKVYGWKWETTPKVGPYAGDKTAIPTNTAKTVPAEAPIERYAGGWDVDRIYVDLGDPGFLESFFRAAVADLANQQETGVAAVLQAEATPGDIAAPADLWAQLDMAARMLQQQGARLTFAGISADLWAQYISGTANDVPWWVVKGNVPSLSDATGNAAEFSFFCNADLDPGTVLAGDKLAVTFYESPTIRVQAVNIPNGGIDLAVFSYQATMVNDARGVVNVVGQVV
jgi:hypothetical protein